jgi:3',5'-cyclic-AMP phosphodiesterase
MKLLVLSDLHLGAETGLVRNHAVESSFDSGWDQIKPLAEIADFLIIAGDIAQHGNLAGYRRLRERTRNVANKLMIGVGNHDDRGRIGFEFGRRHICERGYVQSAIHKEASVIVLDTILPGKPYGEICPDRLAWLEQELSKARARPVVIVMHHPPAELGVKALDEVSLNKGRDQLLDILSKYEAPVTIVAGHHHVAYSGLLRGMQFCIVPAFSGPPAKFGLWGRDPQFGPGSNGALALTIGADGRSEARFLVN